MPIKLSINPPVAPGEINNAIKKEPTMAYLQFFNHVLGLTIFKYDKEVIITGNSNDRPVVRRIIKTNERKLLTLMVGSTPKLFVSIITTLKRRGNII